MGLLDGYPDPERFQAGGGLLGRLLLLPQMQGVRRLETSAAGPFDHGSATRGSGARSMSGDRPPRLSKVGYFEVPTNPNHAFGELLGLQEKNKNHTISGDDYASGVREGL